MDSGAQTHGPWVCWKWFQASNSNQLTRRVVFQSLTVKLYFLNSQNALIFFQCSFIHKAQRSQKISKTVTHRYMSWVRLYGEYLTSCQLFYELEDFFVYKKCMYSTTKSMNCHNSCKNQSIWECWQYDNMTMDYTFLQGFIKILSWVKELLSKRKYL